MVFVTPRPSNLTKIAVERLAEAVAKAFELGIGEPVEPIVHRLGGCIIYGATDLNEVSGGAIVAKSLKNFTIYISQYTSPIRDRFTISHELGHLFLHLEQAVRDNPGAEMRATRWVDLSNPDQQRAEWEANWFAAGLLMPREPFLSSVEKGLDYTAAKFNVSTSAAKIRRKSLQAA